MTSISRIAGGARDDARAQVSTDQLTILGNGTNENPLRAGAGNVTFIADGGQGPHRGKARVGQIVVATPAPPSVGITTVRLASSGLSGASFSELAQAIGIVIADGEGDACLVQSGGLVTLITDVWDSVTKQSGGLTPGSVYYLSNIVGSLTTTAPDVSGTFVVQVGIAFNPTTLLLSLPAFPRFIP